MSRFELTSRDQSYAASLAAWLDAHRAAPTGASFFRYLFIGEDEHFEIEVGFPDAGAIDGDDGVSSSVLATGRYAVTVHTGPYDHLRDAAAALKAWAAENGDAMGRFR